MSLTYNGLPFNIPEIIYLQFGSDIDGNEDTDYPMSRIDLNNATWCMDKIHDSDIVYTRLTDTRLTDTRLPALMDAIATLKDGCELDNNHSNIEPVPVFACDLHAVFAAADAMEATNATSKD